MRFLGALFSLAILLGVCVGGLALAVVNHAGRPGPLQQDIVLDISQGSSVAGAAEKLEQAGVIDNAWMFEIAFRLLASGGKLKAGEYALPAGVSTRTLIDLLIAGKTLARKITVPEGLTSHEIVELVTGTSGLVDAIVAPPDEGTLLPETYHFTKGDTRGDVIARMQSALSEAMAELWPERAENLPFDTPAEALVLASIVEKETGIADERAHIAGVFVNRLRTGMRLQSDPTVIYGLTNGEGPLGRPLTRKDLDTDHPFNTYKIDGLPPRPIANPGRAAIAAVLNPLETENLFFVADGTGGHVFAKTLEEHNRNVAKWRKVQREARTGAESEETDP